MGLPVKTRTTLWIVAIACVLDTGALEVLRVWHPYPFNGFGSDFYVEALPAYRALAHGHVVGFVDAGPSYLGSMVLRAPFALVTQWIGGTSREVYFVSALPGLWAAPVLGGWLIARRGAIAPAHVFLLLIAVLPTTVACLNTGHPEDVLTASLAIAAVTLAADDRGTAAGVMAALAVCSKPWAASVLPVAFVICRDKRRFVGSAAVVSIMFWGPVLVVREINLGAGAAAGSVSSSVGTIFGSPQLLFWLGPGDWLSQHAHPLIVLTSCCIAGAWWVWRRSDEGVDRMAAGLWLLALVFLVRFAFDPWDNAYYPVPFLMALLALGDVRAAGLAVVASFVLFAVDSPNMTYATSASEGARTFAIVAVPLLVGLGTKVFWPPRGRIVSSYTATTPAAHATRESAR